MKTKRQRSLATLRKAIDAVDGKLLALLSSRAEFAAEIGRLKANRAIGVVNATREAEILRRVARRNPGPLGTEGVKSIFRTVIRECRHLQTPVAVAFLGPTVSFSHQAALRRFGHGCTYTALDSIPEIFDAVESGRCGVGVVPVENSTEGIITHTLDCFPESELSIIGEVILEIHLALLSRSPIPGISVVYSHPQALAQCRRYLSSRLPGVRIAEVSSTAEAARRAAVEKSAAAVGSAVAAEVYDLLVLDEGIEDYHHNRTRFLVIGYGRPARTGRDRTSLLMSLKDKPGALSAAIDPIARGRLNLTKIESRPSKEKAWEYLFFIDVDGHRDEPGMARALEEMTGHCHVLRILGSYPKDSEGDDAR